jgi:hypothetical protein
MAIPKPGPATAAREKAPLARSQRRPPVISGLPFSGIVRFLDIPVGCRTLTLAQTEVFAENDGHEKLIALLTATLMTIEGREGVND